MAWKVLVTAISMPTIALFAALIAYQQWRTARNKLKLDLFERRMAVYNCAREAIGTAATSGNLTQEQQIAYLSGIQAAKWLFPLEVVTYLHTTLWHKIVDLELYNTMSERGVPDDERSKHIQARAETIKWVMTQYEALDRLCASELTLKH